MALIGLVILHTASSCFENDIVYIFITKRLWEDNMQSDIFKLSLEIVIQFTFDSTFLQLNWQIHLVHI